MLNRQSLPVWMLADSLIVVLAGGGTLALILAFPLLQSLLAIDGEHKLKANNEEREQQLEQDLDKANDKIGALSDENEDLREFKNAATAKINQQDEQLEEYASAKDQERLLRRELLNLQGDFSRVMFVVDISQSMTRPTRSGLGMVNWDEQGYAWNYVKRQVLAWIEHLPIKAFRVICFNQDIEEYPAVDQRWVAGARWREEAASFLEERHPTGGTQTERALKRALAWQPTTIILFTDGAPSTREKMPTPQGEEDAPDQWHWVYDPDQQESIKRLLDREAENVPVNVIAIGDYFSDGMGTFLQDIAARTGGGFVGL